MEAVDRGSFEAVGVAELLRDGGLYLAEGVPWRGKRASGEWRMSYDITPERAPFLSLTRFFQGPSWGGFRVGGTNEFLQVIGGGNGLKRLFKAHLPGWWKLAATTRVPTKTHVRQDGSLGCTGEKSAAELPS